MGVNAQVPAERICDGAQHETLQYICLVDEMARLVDESVRLSFTFPATQRTTSCGTDICPRTLLGRFEIAQPRLLDVRWAGWRRADAPAAAATGWRWRVELCAACEAVTRIPDQRSVRRRSERRSNLG